MSRGVTDMEQFDDDDRVNGLWDDMAAITSEQDLDVYFDLLANDPETLTALLLEGVEDGR